jgi:hypothetical protein
MFSPKKFFTQALIELFSFVGEYGMKLKIIEKEGVSDAHHHY